MSRDLTPRERVFFNMTIPGIMLANANLVDTNGNRYPIYSEEELELKKRFPNFAASFDMFIQLWKDLPSPKRERTFEKMENLIKNVIVMDKLNDWRACPKDVKKWYLGQLDTNFYYSEENDEMFYNWIISHISNET